MRIKNNKVVEGTWCGQTIQPNEYYSIQRSELPRWQGNESVIVDISSGDLIINDGDADFVDIAEAVNYLLQAEIREVDGSGRQVVKTAAAQVGATYLANMCKITTGLSISSLKWDGSAGDYSVKFYNASDVEVSSGDVNCVTTIVTMEPTYDYEIISGKVHVAEKSTEDVELWVLGGCTDLKHLPGTVAEMVRGINFKYVQSSVISDGRSSKYMSYSTAGIPYPTNKLQFIIKHPAGHQYSMLVAVEMFR